MKLDLLPYPEYAASLIRKRVSAGALFHDGRGRVVLVEPTYKESWEIPGGAAKAGESPRRTAVREVGEELGIDWQGGRLLVIDYVPANGPMPEGLAFVYDGGVLSDSEVEAIVSTDPEIRSVGLYTMDEVEKLVSPGLAHRIRLGLQAIREGLLLEHEPQN
ncbi:NUDIX hydrolase [Crossiella sp. S99.1]|uniref:NUDIX domain-containing protein n=1 Tax=Crossiella sp. S99.1 TaxID=2936271 RepID=UPI001FFE35AF|nr:NUDIX hydrolase [Crossiella sp. S99.1]MCK2245217.1 NUDIX hydrolase [Crossiella sp. S99.2]MCK2258861.1 NUDIX hydrolase [Crossiella sp. S99.1]